MSRVVGGPHHAMPLRTARTAPEAFKPLTLSPAMRAVAERCSTGRIVAMTSNVSEQSEIKRRGEAYAASK